MSDISWTNTRVPLSSLLPWKINPRRINETEADRLAESFDEFGQVETIAISPDGNIYNGHQRLKVLLDIHGGDYEIEARQSSRPLTEDERKKLTVFLHRGAVGEWDFGDVLNEFDVGDLADWGFDEFELEAFGFNMPDFQPTDSSNAPRLDEKSATICPHCGRDINE